MLGLWLIVFSLSCWSVGGNPTVKAVGTVADVVGFLGLGLRYYALIIMQLCIMNYTLCINNYAIMP